MLVPIYKRGSPPGQCISFRPISLLSAFSKLFESLMLKRLNKLVEDKMVLKNNQFRFRAGLSTIHALTALSSYVGSGLNNRHGTIADVIDFSKASVWHQGLLFEIDGLDLITKL